MTLLLKNNAPCPSQSALSNFAPLVTSQSERGRCRVEHEKRNSVSKSNHVLFSLSCRNNSPLLTRKVDCIINENKRIENPHIKIGKCVGALKMNTYVESLQKRTMGLLFNRQKSLGPYHEKKSFRYTAKIGL